MASRFTPGDSVQTRFGKGVVREIRNGNRLMVEVQGATLVVKDNEVSMLTPPRKRSREPRTFEGESQTVRSTRESRTMSAEIDLHGLTVEEALDRVQQALSDAMLADVSELRFIHGRSGGRIRTTLQQCLRDTPSVRKFRLDPRNEGVTIVSL
jgi:DNA mismatch repair protein MutS2